MARNEFHVIRGNEAHARELAPKLRKADLEEIEAAYGVDPLWGLLESVKESTYCRAVMWEGEVAALFGIVPLTYGGSVWMLASDLAEHHFLAFTRMCRREKKGLLAHTAPLTNYIDLRNKRSLRWALWLGFYQGHPEPYGVEGRDFVPVVLHREY